MNKELLLPGAWRQSAREKTGIKEGKILNLSEIVVEYLITNLPLKAIRRWQGEL